MRKEMYNVILEIFENILEYEKGTLQEEFLIKSDLAIDSLKFINFLVQVEEKYGVDLMDDFDEIEDITVGNLCIKLSELIETKQKTSICGDVK